MSAIVITGGAGFVGINLTDLLVRTRPGEIRIIDNLSNSSTGRIERVLRHAGSLSGDAAQGWSVTTPAGTSRVSLHVADIKDSQAALDICADGVAMVVHLAAQTGVPSSLANAREDMASNVVGTFNYLEACRTHGIERFVMASSAAVLGNAPPPQIEDRPSRPTSPYGASKGAAENYCSAYFHSFGIKATALRFSNVYGPLSWSKGSVVAAFCKNVLAGQPLVVNGDGSQTRDLLHITDLVGVIARLMEEDPAALHGRPVNVATGQRTRIGDLAHLVAAAAQAAGRPCEVRFAPARTGDVAVSAPDPSLLCSALPGVFFRPVADAIPATLEWFIANWPEQC